MPALQGGEWSAARNKVSFCILTSTWSSLEVTFWRNASSSVAFLSSFCLIAWPCCDSRTRCDTFGGDPAMTVLPAGAQQCRHVLAASLHVLQWCVASCRYCQSRILITTCPNEALLLDSTLEAGRLLVQRFRLVVLLGKFLGQGRKASLSHFCLKQSLHRNVRRT